VIYAGLDRYKGLVGRHDVEQANCALQIPQVPASGSPKLRGADECSAPRQAISHIHVIRVLWVAVRLIESEIPW